MPNENDPASMPGAKTKRTVYLAFNSFRIGGSQTYYLEVLSRLRDTGFEVEVFAKEGATRSKFEKIGAETHCIPWTEGEGYTNLGFRGLVHKLLDFLLGIFWWLRCVMGRPTAILVSQPMPMKFVRTWTPRKVPLFAIVHGTSSVELPSNSNSKTWARFKVVYCVSEETATAVLDSGAPSTVVLGNLFSGKRYWEGFCPEVSQLAPKGINILFLATLTSNKIDVLNMAMKALQLKPDWFLTVVGDGPEKQSLESLAKRLGIESRISFAGALGDPRNHISNSDVVLAVGRAALEALSYGKPTVLASDGLLFGLVTEENFELAQSRNFTGRAGTEALSVAGIVREVELGKTRQASRVKSLKDLASDVGNFDTLISKLLADADV